MPVVVRDVCWCRKRRTGRRRRWPAWAVAVRKTRYCTARHDGDGGDGAGGATGAVAAADGDPGRTNRAVACWTTRSTARTTDAEPLVAAKTAPPIPTTARAAAMKPSESRKKYNN